MLPASFTDSVFLCGQILFFSARLACGAVAGRGAAERPAQAVINARPSRRAAAGDGRGAGDHPLSSRTSGAAQELRE